MKYLLCLLLVACSSDPRPSSRPYVSGDSFRALAQHVFDETGNHVGKVREGDVVFVSIDQMGEFLTEVWPHIHVPVTLITHNGDTSCPGPYVTLLEDPHVLAWYGQNVDGVTHPKLKPLPIGLANRRWPHGDPKVLEKVQKAHLPKKHLLYLNVVSGTNYEARKPVIDLFKGKSFVFSAENKPYEAYLTDIAESQFVLSPRGNGLDCHRTYEALYLGAYPILLHSSLDPLFEDLPVVLVDSWDEVTESFLQEKAVEFSQKRPALDKLTLAYWKAQFSSQKQDLP